MGHYSSAKDSDSKLENIAIIGNGGRENSLAWIIKSNEKVKNIYLFPGNGGSEEIEKCFNVDLDYLDKEKLIRKLDELDINLVVIGPETPLAYGLADDLRKKNFLVFGPSQSGAKLESSKSWAKEFMKEGNIPTASFWKVSTLEEARKVIYSNSVELVVKADGLASGKGVIIPESKDETFHAAKDCLEGKFGEAGRIVVLEEKIEGPEISIFAMCDGKRYVLLPIAQDHKRLEENDQGLNTGGMGAYAPTPIITQEELQNICNEIIQPTINELNKRNIDYRGVIYFGLMITENGPKVIEYNCRFGDPECQTIMPLMNKDFIHLIHNCAMGKLKGNENLHNDGMVSGCVIATSRGYPLAYETGKKINFDQINYENYQIFHSGTSKDKSGEILTNGGRVLSIVCQDYSYDAVFEKAYKILQKINFDGIFYRKDIGYQVRESHKNK